MYSPAYNAMQTSILLLLFAVLKWPHQLRLACVQQQYTKCIGYTALLHQVSVVVDYHGLHLLALPAYRIWQVKLPANNCHRVKIVVQLRIAGKLPPFYRLWL